MLIALGATVTLQNTAGSRDVALEDFYTHDGLVHTVRQPDEILTAITVPPCTHRTLYLKETARKGNDFSYGVVAAVADGTGEQTSAVRLVLGSLVSQPLLLEEPARIVSEQGLGDSAIKAATEATRAELGNLTNLYTPAIYKSRLGRTLVRLALEGLRELPT